MNGLSSKVKYFAVAALVAAFLAAFAFGGRLPDALASGHSHKGGKVTAAELAFQNAMRKLWEDHITWTRLYIVSAVGDLADANDTAGRLLQNQTDIGDAIKPYYGEEAGEQLEALLTDHILIAADLITAAKSGDTEAFDAVLASWYANADEIAAFLSAANPEAWPVEEMQAMMREHLDLTLAEASARLTGDWAADIAAYDQIHEQILGMADMLSTGIISQFPKQFK